METFFPPSDDESVRREILDVIRKEAEGSRHPVGLRAILDLRLLRDSAHLVQLTHSIVGKVPPKPPTLRGRVGAWIIHGIRRALFWYTPQILEFHRNVARAVEQQVEAIELIARENEDLRTRLDELGGTRSVVEKLQYDLLQEIAGRKNVENWAGSEIRELRSIIGENAARFEQAQQDTAAALAQLRREAAIMEGRVSSAERTIVSLRRELISQQMRLSVLIEQARSRLGAAGSAELAEPIREEQHKIDQHKIDGLYLTFEEQFRGSREEITERQRVYLPTLKEHGIGRPDMMVLDVGCGRGEWLELLRDEGIEARGVDCNRTMISECLDRKLPVIEGDAVAYLRSLGTESLGAVTGFHIVEHMPFCKLLELMDETVRVLKPGGVAIFETPNPANVLVGAERFYLDPTHRHPLPSPLLRFTAEERGLCRVQILELHPWPEAARVPEDGPAVARRFNQLFYGPQDYAVIGWKV